MNEIVIKELINTMSDVELKNLKKQIDVVLNGEIDISKLNLNDIDLYEELNEYINAKRLEGKTEATLKQYHFCLKHMIDFVNKPTSYIRTEDIRNFLIYNKTTRKICDTTLESQRLYINGYFEWLKMNGYINNNPCNLIKPIKTEKKEREPLTDLEMEKLRAACTCIREKLILELLYSTGCRVSELVNIKLSDISLDRKEILLHGKGRKERTSFINARCQLMLIEYMKIRKSDSEYLIVSQRAPYHQLTTRTIENNIKNLGIKAGIESRVFPHRIRHTTATDALNRGMPIDQVQILLGHENIKTTQIYAKNKKEVIKTSHAKYII